MWVAKEQVVILSSTIPGDEELNSYKIGDVTFAMSRTEWGVKSDIDLAERLGLHEKDAKTPPELLR